jgi:ABC-2 type transport system ATP-binding protein
MLHAGICPLSWPNLTPSCKREVFLSSFGSLKESEETMTMAIVEVNRISKSYGGRQAVSDVSFSLQSREVLGLLGPNGSGKSTLMKTISGIIKPDAGSIQILGTDVVKEPVEIKKRIGYVPEAPRIYEFLTGVEYLDFVADVHGLEKSEKQERVSEFLKALDLEGRENELIHGYSQGMKQKLAIIAALLHRPQVLVLDEPLNALDPRSARIVKDLIHKLRDDGVPTIFSTHVLEIADAICDRVIIMYDGKIIAEGTAQELKMKAGSAGSTLEEVFLKLTGTSDTREVVEALSR